MFNLANMDLFSEKRQYSVSADMDVSDLHSGVMDYGRAKFMYDRWKKDPEVFNVVMYEHVDGKKVIVDPGAL